MESCEGLSLAEERRPSTDSPAWGSLEPGIREPAEKLREMESGNIGDDEGDFWIVFLSSICSII